MNYLLRANARSVSRNPIASSSARRGIHAPASSIFKIPAQTKTISTPLEFFTIANRAALIPFGSKVGTWEEFFNPSLDLTALGMSPQERRYTKWLMEKFRQGHDLAQIGITPKPKKTIRGWGPAVQNGIRVR